MERKRQRLAIEDTEERIGRIFSAYGKPLTAVPLFMYLERKLSSYENDWMVLGKNLRRAQGEWGRLAKILGKEGEYRRMVERFYTVVVQAVLLFGSKTWVLTPQLEKPLKSFHHWSTGWYMGVYTHWGGAVNGGTEKVGVFITLCQNIVTQAERKPGLRLSSQWWEKTALDILGIRAGHAVEDGGEEMGIEELE